jgi:hypothetical protein
MLFSPSQWTASTGLRPEPSAGATGDGGRTPPPLFVIGGVDRGVPVQYHPQQQDFAAVKKLNTSVSVDELYRKWCIDSNPNTKHNDHAETSLSVMGTPTMMLSSPSSILYPSASNATAASSSTHRHDRRDTSSHLEGLLSSLSLLEYNTPTHQRNHFDAMSTSRYYRTLVVQPPQPPSLLSGAAAAAAATPASARELHAASRALTDRIHHLEVLNHHSYIYRQQGATSESLRDQGARSEASSSSGGRWRGGVGHRSSNINSDLSGDQIHNTVNGAAAPQSGGTDIKDTAVGDEHDSRGASSGAALDALDHHSRLGDATPNPTTTTASSTTAAFLAEQVAALHRDNDALQRHFLETTERHEEERTNALQGMRDRHRRTELQWLEELELHKVRCATLEGSLKDARHTHTRLQSRIEELEAAVEREKTHAGVRERELLLTIGGLQRDVTLLSLSSQRSAPTMVTEQQGGGGGHAPPPSPPRSASVQRIELLRSSSAIVSGDLDSSLDAENNALNQTPSLHRAANSVALQFSNDDASNDDTVMIAALADSLLPPSARATAPAGSPDAIQPLQPPHPDAGQQRDALLMPMAFGGCGHRVEPQLSAHAARLHADPTSSASTESDGGGGGAQQCPHCAQNQRRLDRARAELVESTQQWSCIAEEVADFASAVLRGVRREASVAPSASL